MTNLKKIVAVGLTALTIGVAFADSAEAQWRRGYHRGGGWGRGGAVAAGVIGGALLGAAIAPRAYGAPVYGAPAYGGPVYYTAPAPTCGRVFVGYDAWGRAVYQRQCW